MTPSTKPLVLDRMLLTMFEFPRTGVLTDKLSVPGFPSEIVTHRLALLEKEGLIRIITVSDATGQAYLGKLVELTPLGKRVLVSINDMTGAAPPGESV